MRHAARWRAAPTSRWAAGGARYPATAVSRTPRTPWCPRTAARHNVSAIDSHVPRERTGRTGTAAREEHGASQRHTSQRRTHREGTCCRSTGVASSRVARDIEISVERGRQTTSTACSGRRAPACLVALCHGLHKGAFASPICRLLIRPACACEQICAAALTAYSNPSQHFMMVEVSEPHAPSASEASHTRKKPGYTHKHPEGLTSAGPTWNFARVFVEGQEGKHTYARVC